MENKIKDMGIYELRNYARKIGVSSPTLKKKPQIINEINLILTNKLQPKFNKTKVGRPPKCELEIEIKQNDFSQIGYVKHCLSTALRQNKAQRKELKKIFEIIKNL